MELNKFINDLVKEESLKKSDNVGVYMKMRTYQKELNISDNHLEKVRVCSELQKHAIDTELGKAKELYIETCQDRFCPMCQARQSIKHGIKIATLMTYGSIVLGYEYIFITLTVPSVKGEKLKSKLSEINKGIAKLMKRKRYIDTVIPAFITKIEVNYNRSKDTYNPHIHMICAVNGSKYFRKTNKDYIKQEQLLKDWQEVMKDNTISQVNIKPIRTDNSITESALEIAKYQSKSKDYNCKEEVFKVFYKALKGSKALRYNREFNELGKVYDNDKWGLFEKYKPKDKDENKANYTMKLIMYYWFKSKKYGQEWETLTEAEKNIIDSDRNYKTYLEFRRESNKSVAYKDNEKAKLEELENKLKEHKEKQKQHSYHKARIQTVEDMIKKQKQKIYKVNAELSMFDYIEKNMKQEFKE